VKVTLNGKVEIDAELPVTAPARRNCSLADAAMTSRRWKAV
jgi:hypothetical protein